MVHEYMVGEWKKETETFMCWGAKGSEETSDMGDLLATQTMVMSGPGLLPRTKSKSVALTQLLPLKALWTPRGWVSMWGSKGFIPAGAMPFKESCTTSKRLDCCQELCLGLLLCSSQAMCCCQ